MSCSWAPAVDAAAGPRRTARAGPPRRRSESSTARSASPDRRRASVRPGPPSTGRCAAPSTRPLAMSSVTPATCESTSRTVHPGVHGTGVAQSSSSSDSSNRHHRGLGVAVQASDRSHRAEVTRLRESLASWPTHVGADRDDRLRVRPRVPRRARRQDPAAGDGVRCPLPDAHGHDRAHARLRRGRRDRGGGGRRARRGAAREADRDRGRDPLPAVRAAARCAECGRATATAVEAGDGARRAHAQRRALDRADDRDR